MGFDETGLITMHSFDIFFSPKPNHLILIDHWYISIQYFEYSYFYILDIMFSSIAANVKLTMVRPKFIMIGPKIQGHTYTKTPIKKVRWVSWR